MKVGTLKEGYVIVRIPPQASPKAAPVMLIGCLHVEMTPENIPLGIYTHINFAFALINPDTFRIAPMDDKTASRYRSVVALKRRQPALKVWIAIGGWAMNDPGPTQTTFSDLAASEENQHAFFESLVSFVLNNGFDGVDLDWEYPVADDRGGKPKDFDNFVTFIKRLRERLNQSPRHIGLSITLVCFLPTLLVYLFLNSS